MIRTYSELRLLPTFKERFDYLKLGGVVGESTFGFDRYLNQEFYKSTEWKRIRDEVIVRDGGCDLGIPGFEIHDMIVVHHMNVIAVDDILSRSRFLVDPEFLICVNSSTHHAIHLNDQSLIRKDPVVRQAGDTRLW